MVKKQYTVERVGQMDFFDNYRVPYNDDVSVLVDNTDGVFLKIMSDLYLSFKSEQVLIIRWFRRQILPQRTLL